MEVDLIRNRLKRLRETNAVGENLDLFIINIVLVNDDNLN
jgi:hypothetical protein